MHHVPDHLLGIPKIWSHTRLDYPCIEATSIYDRLDTYEEIDALMRKQ